MEQTKQEQFTTNCAIYGYKKDPENKYHWLIDEEAAAVVRRIFQLTIEGKGPMILPVRYGGQPLRHGPLPISQWPALQPVCGRRPPC